MIAGTTGSLFGKEKNIKRGQCKISEPLLADFFEMFTLPANLKLNTQRRSAPSMCAFKEEERSVLISVTLMKGITGYKTANYWHHVLYVSEGSNHVTST